MSESVFERSIRWTQLPGVDYTTVFGRVEYLAKRRFFDYEPAAYPPHLDFMARLAAWLDSAGDEEDQKVMMQLVPRLFYVGMKEFESLYRCAFTHCVTRWLIEELQLGLFEPLLSDRLSSECSHTWFCSVTDSMHISSFHHVNNLTGHSLRPDFLSLSRLGDESRIARYMDKKGLRRLVLLEDFACSGDQLKRPLIFAARLPNQPSVLVVPLISCPSAVVMCDRIAAKYHNVKASPVMVVPSDFFVYESDDPDSPSFMRQLRSLALKLHPKVVGSTTPDDNRPPYGPFGYGSARPKAGGLVVMHSNTPNNSLPLLHYTSDTWTPVFPRSSRA